MRKATEPANKTVVQSDSVIGGMSLAEMEEFKAMKQRQLIASGTCKITVTFARVSGMLEGKDIDGLTLLADCLSVDALDGKDFQADLNGTNIEYATAKLAKRKVKLMLDKGMMATIKKGFESLPAVNDAGARAGQVTLLLGENMTISKVMDQDIGEEVPLYVVFPLIVLSSVTATTPQSSVESLDELAQLEANAGRAVAARNQRILSNRKERMDRLAAERGRGTINSILSAPSTSLDVLDQEIEVGGA